MNIEFTRNAQISLDHLPEREQGRVKRLLTLLHASPDLHVLRGKYFKLKSDLRDLYMARASKEYRILFQQKGDTLLVLDIVHHDRIEGLSRALQGGGQ
jgi:mRNA-degrading endonuclease RelE of RelBE toxin-antitoxin system